jgi:phage shock protein PspC (stress-responsive transcriptional regulator)
MVGGTITILSINAGVNLMLLLKTLLSFTFIFGYFIMWYIIEQRKYYVKTARYINEIRKTHLAAISNEFKNKTGYYTDYDKPAYFSWKSSQVLLIIILSFFNSVTLGILAYVCNIRPLILDCLIVLVTLTIHIMFAWFILRRSGKTSPGHRHLA